MQVARMSQHDGPWLRSDRSPRWPANWGSLPSTSSLTAETRRRCVWTRSAAEAERPPGKLILVSAITPTPAGEGKTTTSIGLAQGLCRIGKRVGAGLAPAVDGPGIRPQGGRHRRRREPGRAVEHDQPPVHRRLPRDHGRPQPARRRDRQPAPFRRHDLDPTACSGSAPST